MDQEKYYSLSEAAKIVGVPRTTINDWIGKHSNYIHFETNGRRKVLTDSGIEVLKEIGTLRETGLGAPEIERKLAENHPVKVDEVTDDKKRKTDENADEVAEYAVIARRQTDEIGSLLGEHLQNLATRLESAENERKNFSKQMIRSVVTTVLLMLLIPVMTLVFTAVIYRSMQQKNNILNNEVKAASETNGKLEKENFRLLQDLKEDANKIKARDNEISRVSIMLDRREKDFEQNVAKLQAEIKRQKKEFAAALAEKSKDAKNKHEAEIAKMRDDFAGKQLERLKKLENLERQLEDKEKIIDRLSKVEETQAKTIKEQSAAISKITGQAGNIDQKPSSE